MTQARVEPFTRTQASISPGALSVAQRRMVLDFLWETYYLPYREQMFSWEGKPLVVAFDPMRLVEEERFTLRHRTGRARSASTVNEGWDWNFGPPQAVKESISSDGVVFVYPRFDERGLGYPTWEPRVIDPLLEEGVYENQWRSLREERDHVQMIVLYSWNLYGEQAQIEPSTGGPAPVEDEYVDKTRRLYREFLEGEE